MIHRVYEGDTLQWGLNWSHDARTYLELKAMWRSWTHGYVLGFRLSRRQCGHMFIPRCYRWELAPAWLCSLVGHDWSSEQSGVSWCIRCDARDIDYAIRPDLKR